jgi:ATP-dependent DNA ligase
MENIYDIIKQLESTPGRNDKISILESNKDNELLKMVLNAALNPYRQYFIKQFPKVDNFSGDSDLFIFLYALADQIESRAVTGNAARDLLTKLTESLTPEDAEVAKRVVTKDLKCGVQASTVNKVWKDFIPTYPCLLGKAYNEKTIQKITFPCYAQLKADGIRANIIVNEEGNVSVRGRSGKLIDLLGKLENEIPVNDSGYVLDGELLVLDDDGNSLPRKQGNGILNKAIRGTISEKEADAVVFRAWDYIPLDKFKGKKDDTPYCERVDNTILKVGNINSSKITMIESMIVSDMDEVNTYFQSMLEKGEEGCMLKNLDHPWEDKRSPHLVKMKAEKDCDLIVTGWNRGNEGTKFSDQMGSLICESSDGKISVSISGFSEEQRLEITQNIDEWMGRIVTVLYNERIESKDREADSLFLPRFAELREDKTEADSSEKIK